MIPFGRYYLHRRLAVGGMAEIFLATRSEGSDDLLVVKRILPHLESREDFVRMFVDEANLSSSLDHPNVVRIHEFGEAAGLHFMAMEYVDGLPLGSLLSKQPNHKLPIPLSCWIIAEACAGLDHAHKVRDADGNLLGLVHRDISPDNILLSRAGQVKIADFGIAKAATRLTQTSPGQLKGKFAYMSPEQATARTIDARSDLFTIGLVLYEMTTGRRAFDAPNQAGVLRALVQHEYQPPRQFDPTYPQNLAVIIDRTLAWSPDERYQQVADLREALLTTVGTGEQPREQLTQLVAQHGKHVAVTVESKTAGAAVTRYITEPGVLKGGPTAIDQMVVSQVPRAGEPPQREQAAALWQTKPTSTGDSQQATASLVALRPSPGRSDNQDAQSTTGVPPTEPVAEPAPVERLPQTTVYQIAAGAIEPSSARSGVIDSAPTKHREASSSPAPAKDNGLPKAIVDRMFAFDSTADFDGGDKTAQILDRHDLKAIEGFPWGWFVVGILLSLLVLLATVLSL